jgi:flagellar hook-basal body complex protein FliE
MKGVYLNQYIQQAQNQVQKKPELPGPSASEKSEKSFFDHLKDSVNEVNLMQKTADTKSTDLATGKNENIHETMLAVNQAELGFQLLVQIRNKALEAYQEVMRMSI